MDLELGATNALEGAVPLEDLATVLTVSRVVTFQPRVVLVFPGFQRKTE